MASKHLQPESAVKIVLLGKIGVGKTSLMNTILGWSKNDLPPTTECKEETGVIGGQELVFIDTPGWANNRLTKEEVEREFRKCILLAAPGPHLFLYVRKFDAINTYEERAVRKIFDLFGKKSKSHFLAVFIHKHEVDEDEIKNIKKTFIGEFGGGFLFFDNKNEKPKQVSQLLTKISELKKQGRYTNKSLTQAGEVKHKKMENEGMTPADAVATLLEKLLDELPEPLKTVLRDVAPFFADQAFECSQM